MFTCTCNKKGNPRVRDKCLKNVLQLLSELGIRTRGSCCGHSKYPVTIVIRVGNKAVELFSGKEISRTKRFILYKTNRKP